MLEDSQREIESKIVLSRALIARETSSQMPRIESKNKRVKELTKKITKKGNAGRIQRSIKLEKTYSNKSRSVILWDHQNSQMKSLPRVKIEQNRENIEIILLLGCIRSNCRFHI